MSNKSNFHKYLQTASYYLAVLILGFVGLIKASTLPDLAQNTSVNLSQITYVLSAGSIGYLVGSFLGGRLFDRFSGHKIIAAATFIAACLLAFIPLLQTLSLMLMIFFLFGLLIGIIELGTNTLILWVHGENSGPFMSALHFFFGVGALLCPLLVSGVVRQTGSIDWSYWIIVLSMLPIAVLFLLVPSPPIRKEPQKEKSSMADRTINTNTGLILLFTMFLFLYVGTEIGFSDWVFTYAKVRLPDNLISQAYQLSSAFWIAMTVGRFIAIPLTLKIDTRLLLILDVFGSIFGFGIILIGGQSLTAMWIGVVMAGLSMASIFPLTFVLAEKLMDVSGRISSYLMVGASSGSIILPWILGQLIEFSGTTSIIITLFVTMLLDLGMLFLLILNITRSYTKMQG